MVDLDAGQGTLHEWAHDRAVAGLTPAVKVRLGTALGDVLAGASPDTDLIIIDGPARADDGTLELARVADLIVQPTGAGLDDLRPAVRTFNSLVANGIPKSKLLLALCRIGNPTEAADARVYLTSAGYAVAEGYVPERVSYRRLHNAGKAITEARHPTLKVAAATVIQSTINAAVAAASQNAEAAE